MHAFDPAPPPYSTLLGLTAPAFVGISLVLKYDGEVSFLGIGMVIGAFFALVVKKAAELDDKAMLSAVLGLFRSRGKDDSE